MALLPSLFFIQLGSILTSLEIRTRGDEKVVKARDGLRAELKKVRGELSRKEVEYEAAMDAKQGRLDSLSLEKSALQTEVDQIKEELRLARESAGEADSLREELRIARESAEQIGLLKEELREVRESAERARIETESSALAKDLLASQLQEELASCRKALECAKADLVAKDEENSARLGVLVAEARAAAVKDFQSSAAYKEEITTAALPMYRSGVNHVMRMARIENPSLSLETLARWSEEDPFCEAARALHSAIPFMPSELEDIAKGDVEDGKGPWVPPVVDARNLDSVLYEIAARRLGEGASENGPI